MTLLRTYRRLWLCCLLLAALVAQGLIPAGFMPTVHADSGKVAIVICTGTGPATIMMDAHMVPGADNDGPDSYEAAPTCLFAPVMAAGAADIVPPALLHPAPVAERFVALAATVPSTLLTKDWLSQGPPHA